MGWAPRHTSNRIPAGARSSIAFQSKCQRILADATPEPKAATAMAEQSFEPNSLLLNWLLKFSKTSPASPALHLKRAREREPRAFQGGVRRCAVAPTWSVKAVTLFLFFLNHNRRSSKNAGFFCASVVGLVQTEKSFCTPSAPVRGGNLVVGSPPLAQFTRSEFTHQAEFRIRKVIRAKNGPGFV